MEKSSSQFYMTGAGYVGSYCRKKKEGRHIVGVV